MATLYPKASRSQVMGLLVLLRSHGGSQDVAILADDLELELDEILPAIEFAEALDLVRVADGRATLTSAGEALLAGSITGRRALLREQLKQTTLYRTILRALETAPEHRLSMEELYRLLEFTPAAADDATQTILNWGRYADLFRVTPGSDAIVLVSHPGRRAAKASGGGARGGPPAAEPTGPPSSLRAPSAGRSDPNLETAPVA